MAGRRDDPVMVYSTERGLVCPTCRLPMAGCRCGKKEPAPAGDGIVRVRRETKGRGGKTVTTVSGVPLGGEALRSLASDLKRRCGTGGTVKDGCDRDPGRPPGGDRGGTFPPRLHRQAGGWIKSRGEAPPARIKTSRGAVPPVIPTAGVPQQRGARTGADYS